MPAPDASEKAAVSVSEMAEMCEISRSRWYELVEAGVFPGPVVLLPIKRPVYDRSLIEKCLQIKETGIGLSGTPVVFNRKRKWAWPTEESFPSYSIATPPTWRVNGRWWDSVRPPICTQCGSAFARRRWPMQRLPTLHQAMLRCQRMRLFSTAR